MKHKLEESLRNDYPDVSVVWGESSQDCRDYIAEQLRGNADDEGEDDVEAEGEEQDYVDEEEDTEERDEL